jgi:uncharacterized cupredoxin-like copper-binding protein
VAHEAVIGDASVQAAHEAARRFGLGHDDHATPDVTVDPGATGSLTYTFSTVGTIVIGCHFPGHYDLGMHATVTVT